MRILKSIKSFTQKWLQSWKTQPEFILTKKSLAPRQISKKFSFLNALISGALSVRTLLSILVGIAGITSIVVYDTVINAESPMFVSNAVSETENKELLAEISHLLSSQPESVFEPPIEMSAEPVQKIDETEPVAVLEPNDVVITEVSPPTGDKDITALFILPGVLYILIAIIFKLKKQKIRAIKTKRRKQ